MLIFYDGQDTLTSLKKEETKTVKNKLHVCLGKDKEKGLFLPIPELIIVVVPLRKGNI